MLLQYTDRLEITKFISYKSTLWLKARNKKGVKKGDQSYLRYFLMYAYAVSYSL